MMLEENDAYFFLTLALLCYFIDILSKWPLFGSSFFAVKRVSDPKERSDHILALNRHGVHFIDLVTHVSIVHNLCYLVTFYV
jgi:myosin-15